jgi:exonuclease VII small subunit
MPRFENLEPLIEDAKPFHGFVAKPFDLRVEKRHRFAHAVESMIDCFESDIHMAPELREFLPPAIVRVKAPVDRLNERLEASIKRLEAFIKRLEAAIDRLETAIDRFKTPVDRAEQLLIRHKLTLPRREPSVKKVYVV